MKRTNFQELKTKKCIFFQKKIKKLPTISFDDKRTKPINIESTPGEKNLEICSTSWILFLIRLGFYILFVFM